MTPNKSQNSAGQLAGSSLWRRLVPVSLALVAISSEAGAAQKTYQYFRFEPKQVQASSTQIQLSEFTFSLNGTLLNLNNRNGSGVNPVPVSGAAAAQNPDGGEGPNKVFDGQPLVNGGSPSTKWFNGAALTEPLDITFTAPVTVDSYNFATANDSASYARTPTGWFLYGRNSTSDPWVVIDARSGVTVTTANNTYQAGYTIPDSVPPVVNLFGTKNSAPDGTAAIVLNSDAAGVKLEWNTSLGDTNGTTISPAPGAVTQVGTATVDPPDNATTEYTITATRAAGGPFTATRTTKVRSVVGGTSNFQYIRYKATKLKTGLATGVIQLAEFGFQNNGVAVPIVGASQTGANTPANEDITKLWDGISTTTTNKWLDFNNAAVVFDLGAGAPAITHYFFYTANDAQGRDPIQWTLEGSSDQTSWTLIDNVDFDYPTTGVRNTTSRSIPLPGASLPPSIGSFVGNGTTMFEGSPLVFSWTTAGAATASIDHGVGAVGINGSTTVYPPLGSTTYTLTAASAGGAASSTKTFTVTVLAGSGPATINYADFNGAANEFTFQGSTVISNGNLVLTPDSQGQQGEAWLRTLQNVNQGFEVNFGLSMTHNPADGFVPADGVAFVIQNHPQGSSAPSTGEGGVTTNALNITFKNFGFDIANASRVQVLNGTASLGQVSLGTLPGITYNGVTNYPYSMVGMPGTAPYRVRVVYTPGDEDTDSLLDVYVNEVAVIENLIVNLEQILGTSGPAFVGFSARTGLYTQLNQITYWNMKFGDFSALPPFGLVKGFQNKINGTNTWDLVWNASEGMTYTIQSTSDFDIWDDETSFGGESGQIGAKIAIDPAEPKRFYRVVEEPEE